MPGDVRTTKWKCREILGIEPTRDKAVIDRAWKVSASEITGESPNLSPGQQQDAVYLRLKSVSPTIDQELQKLKCVYEDALSIADEEAF